MNDDKTIIGLSNFFHHESDPDHTILVQPELCVSLLDNCGKSTKQFLFTHHFSIGRSPDNDIVITTESISRYHAEIKQEKGNWWIHDLNSANGTYLDHKLIEQKSLLHFPAIISLGTAGAFLRIETTGHGNSMEKRAAGITGSVTKTLIQSEQGNPVHGNLSAADLKIRLLAKAEAKDTGEYTRMIRRIIHEDRVTQSKSYKQLISALGFLFLLSAGWVIYQQMTLASARALAVDMFYDIKTLEVGLSQAEIRLKESAEAIDLTMQVIVNEKLELEREKGKIRIAQKRVAAEKTRIARERQRLSHMKARYQQYVDEMKSLKLRFPTDSQYEEELIIRVARGFGESELELPEGFINEVKRYIERWQKSTRMKRAMKYLSDNYYAHIIIDALEKEGLPTYFIYLPLQESDYNTHAIGPETRHGIAKGAWQFLATTGQEYGLSPGPLADTREYDEQDERFNFNLATQAGARYLKHIYSTQAQASGLLVMAGYNYGHNRVRNMISKMPDNPRDRNFWKFIQQYEIPKETYDYVFLIFAAAVIGEDPEHFGFNFKSPLMLTSTQ
jgi:membrane-bound lytic murein transglycosylase D